jgi:hypothetical protein
MKKSKQSREVFSLKNFIILFLSLGILVFISFWAGRASRASYALCDFNHDGKVDGADAQIFLSYGHGVDINLDGKIDLVDFTLYCMMPTPNYTQPTPTPNRMYPTPTPIRRYPTPTPRFYRR